jgi:hypothetical protein
MLSNFAISDSQPNAQRTVRKKLGGLHQAVLLVAVVMYSSASFAQSAANISNSDKDLIQALLRRVEQLESRVTQLEASNHQPATQPAMVPQGPPPAVVAPEPAPEQMVEPQRMDAKTLLQIRGFGDMTFHGSDMKGSTNSFSLGQLNLFVTSDISEKFRLLSEIVFEGDDNNVFGVDVERLLLQYSHNDYFNLSVGRYHTDIGFYNTAYHHSAWLQTAAGRPFLFLFEDQGGILPVHNVGFSLTGLVPSGRLGLHYVAEVGNGRASRLGAEAVQSVVDENNGKAINLALFARPNAVRGLQLGFSAYHDTLRPFPASPQIGENIFAAHAVLQRPAFEWLNEAMVIRHSVQNAHVFATPAFYTQISKAFGKYRPYFRYQYLNSSDAEPIFPSVGLQYGPSLGVRFDPTEAVALKLQYDHGSFRHQTPVNSAELQFAFTF